MSYLLNFKEFNGGYVTFEGGANGDRITGKGTIQTCKLDFEDVYFVKELKFNLFSVSQMCDKKNNVLFTDTECLVLSPNFKLPDESQILLRVPRWNNMYSVDMKNIVPKESLTCLVAKATLDESMLWHRRLGHINFKNINKLVKDNLVRGLPSKCFENDQTCIACLKEKQHKASCKSKIHNTLTQPLFMLYIDLFGPTFVSSLMNKKYCLVVTDDYSRFPWVFFLTTKNETTCILKQFITEIENLVDKKNKVIRCDNKTEFKNSVMSDFCIMNGIRREFSVAMTPQQNGVAERKNMTLIEAARTMLADFKLPTTFWAEAVNTACYVQNMVLIVKPNNKTLYKLFRGRTPALSFIKPFGCHVTILNTLDHLVKFDGKADEGFFVGYSLNSEAFRVFNTKTRKVEENLHIRFLEDKPSIAGNRPKWLFDIDVLTNSMNYVPVIAGTNFNDFARTDESIGKGLSSKEIGSSQDYILLPLWKDGSLFNPSSKKDCNDEPRPSSDARNKDDEGVSKQCETGNQEKPKSSILNVNTARPSINTSSTIVNTVSLIVTTATPETTYDDILGETEGDMSNITATYQVYSTSNTRIHKDHSLDNVISDLQSGVLTRKMSKTINEQGFISAVYEKKTHEDLNTWIKEEVNVFQPPGFKDPDHPDKVYKVVKALYRLHQAPRACQDKYVIKVLRKFNLIDVKPANTLVDTKKHLVKDTDGDDVDVHLYRSMIGSLMYLTSSRPYIIDSPFELVVYTDSDYAGASLDRKSTTRGCTLDSELNDGLWVKTVNDDVRLQALVDGKKVIMNEALIRRHLRLDDAKGVGFSRVITPLFDTMMVQAAEEMGEVPTDSQNTPIVDQPSSSQPQRKQKSRRRQRKETEVPHDKIPHEEHVPTPSNDPLLSDKVNQAVEIEKLKKRVKNLKDKKKKKNHGLKRLYKVGLSSRVESSEDVEASLGDQEDASKQGRNIAEIDQDEETTLVSDQDMFRVNNLDGEEVFVDVLAGEKEEKSEKVIEKKVSAADPITTAGEVVTTVDVEKKEKIMMDEQVARELEAQIKAEIEEEQRLTREKHEANIAMIAQWDNVQATIDANK
nr:putative ribonuclease H-like domain-containing protein [Tanacetum cinerariifolium]